MPHTPRLATRDSDPSGDVQPDLAELCRVYDVGLHLIERSHDLEELLDGILDEYERRLAELPNDALDRRRFQDSDTAASKLRALVMFATQAAALKQKAAAAGELKHRAQALADANAQLESALSEAQTARSRLDAVLAALDAGILILGRDGTVRKANRAARQFTGIPEDGADATPAAPFLDRIPRGSDGEVVVAGEDGTGRVLMVARRDLDGDSDAEVVLLSDITERSREIEERHRLEKLAEVLRTLGVLSHKINNPLTALLGRAQILKAIRTSDPQVTKAAGVIEESSSRIAELIRELARVVKEGRQEAVEKVLDVQEKGTTGGGER